MRSLAAATGGLLQMHSIHKLKGGKLSTQQPTSGLPAGSRGPVKMLSQPIYPMHCTKHTSSSILASAMSCSLPLPLAIFCASAIWFLTAYESLSVPRPPSSLNCRIAERTSALKSSSGNPSTALMLSDEFGWTTAKPPDTTFPRNQRFNSFSFFFSQHRPSVFQAFLAFPTTYRRIACCHPAPQ